MVEKVLFQFRRSLASLAVRRSRGCQGTHIGVKHITIVRVGYKEIEVAHAAAADDDGKEIWATSNLCYSLLLFALTTKRASHARARNLRMRPPTRVKSRRYCV